MYELIQVLSILVIVCTIIITLWYKFSKWLVERDNIIPTTDYITDVVFSNEDTERIISKYNEGISHILSSMSINRNN